MLKSPDTKTSVYQSNYTDKLVRSDQKIAEIIIERQALKSAVKLNQNFWNERQWKGKFLTQMRLATALLKRYNYKTIINVLNNKGKNIFSLSANWLDSLLEEEQNKLERDEELQQLTLQNNSKQEPAKAAESFRTNNNKDRFDKLESL